MAKKRERERTIGKKKKKRENQEKKRETRAKEREKRQTEGNGRISLDREASLSGRMVKLLPAS